MLKALALMGLVLLTFGFLCGRPAQAQSGYPGGGSGGGYPGGGGSSDPGHYWAITYDHSNTISQHFVRDVPTLGQMTPTQSAGGSTILNDDDEDTITATLTWVPAAGLSLATDPPSEPVHIHESGRAWQQSLGSGATTGTVDDGLGDPASDGGHTSQGTHVLQKDGSSGTITLDAVTLKAINPVSTWQSQSGYPGGSSGYPGDGGTYYSWDWTGGEDSISLDVAVVDDNRAVAIISPIETSYYKGNSQGGYSNRWEHVRTSSGGMAVDAAVSWQDASGGGLDVYDSAKNKGWQVTNLPLTATPINFLGDPTYSWSLQGLSPGLLTHTSGNPALFSVYKADGSGFPLHGAARVTATDIDGATCSNYYDMTWHLPVEPHDLISSVKNPKEKMDGPLNPDPCYPGLPPLQNRASPEGDINIAAGLDAVGLILGATRQEGAAGIVEILAKLAETVELKHHYGGEAAKSYTNNQDLWNACVHTAAQAEHNADPSLLTMTDATGRLDGFERTTMQIWIVKYTLHKVWKADFYDAHGFTHDGTVYADPIDDPDGIKPEPYYTKQNLH